ncbi:MAG: hypothetical protein GTO45_09455 [Candidatus Aminicenantes bacterium]|nr:hypothetical protein [Candidatus Aminicenantes bacterium]NIM79040.1 hypothetical protein [Candidatus Aminicenantes bacterium]NIN18319.1 hypothetical protein [Candidatus Aminicenantes bacterium]NIN42206.1 hypothetical protein [Candidatus Aminicenantes bacterium]NIN84972.1 hypothetical protein [Candidatus Aminicenantes bacterium]
MHKKRNVFALLFVSIFLTGTLVQALSQKPEKVKPQPFKWKVVSEYPANFPIFNNSIEKFVNDVKAISNGQLDIEFYAAGEYKYKTDGREEKKVDTYGVFDAVSNGIVEMGFGAPIYWRDNVPGCEFMYAVPFGLNSEGMYAWLYKGGGLELWRELSKPYNVLPFPIGNTGEAMGGWFDKKIEKIEDFNGLNIRMSGFCSRIYKKLEANEHWMVAGEALDAFKKGKINAIICQGPYHDKQHRFHRGGAKILLSSRVA